MMMLWASDRVWMIDRDAERRRSERSFKADSYSKSETRVMANRVINGTGGGCKA